MIVKVKIIKSIFLVLFLFLGFFIVNFSKAAPAPWGIALNQETRQCAGYWAGDEFTHYALPEGWQDYYFDNELREGLVVDDCLQISDSGDYDYKNCCDKMNYEYVADNIGEGLATFYNDYDLEEEVEKEIERSIGNRIVYYVLGFGLFLVVILVVLVVYFVRRKRK